jgi:hypothetical protein
MIIVDAHEDLAYNMHQYGRDYTLSAAENRRREAGGATPQRSEDSLLGIPDYRRGRVAVIFSTLFVSPLKVGVAEWEVEAYANSQQAYQLYGAQIDIYQRLVEEHPDKFRLLQARPDLESILGLWNNLPDTVDHEGSEIDLPVGLVISMEGAEGVRSVDDLEEWGSAACVSLVQPGAATAIPAGHANRGR